MVASANHDGREKKTALIDQAGLERLGGKHRTTDRELALRRLFQLPDRLWVEGALDTSLPARGCLECCLLYTSPSPRDS